jgi:hypothetical protein
LFLARERVGGKIEGDDFTTGLRLIGRRPSHIAEANECNAGHGSLMWRS